MSVDQSTTQSDSEKKAKRNILRRARYQANKVKEAAKVRAYRAANKEKMLDYERAQYYANREHRIEYSRAWNEANKEKRKTYREANKEKISEYQRAYREANKEKFKHRDKVNNLKKYGLTLTQYEEMINGQANRCLCCDKQFGLSKQRRPHVDHDHTTGQIRGILCGICNVMLGHADDNSEILRACADYLDSFKES